MEEGQTASGTTHPTVDFPQFTKLPTEIRLQIWRHALEAPRLIDTRATYLALRRTPHWTDGRGQRREDASPLCFANRESRSVVLEHRAYVFFGTETAVPPVFPREQIKRSMLCPLEFAAAANDVVVVCAGALATMPIYRFSGDCGRVRRVLVTEKADRLFDVLGHGPWHPSGWPHTASMRRAMAREAFARLHSILGRGDLRTVYCLPDGWTSPGQGHKGALGPPGWASDWSGDEVLRNMVTLYDVQEDEDGRGGRKEGRRAHLGKGM
ncbi:hypothetical protein DL770_008330 [Monosporascus sp. CRB-9-2]|nr:hypothetical protein DL770_008330 [Monosporascus sp. CRB-9-2]